MRLKLAERDRLLALAEEAERSADAEAANVAEIQAQLEELLRRVAATQQALAEVGGGEVCVGGGGGDQTLCPYPLCPFFSVHVSC